MLLSKVFVDVVTLHIAVCNDVDGLKLSEIHLSRFLTSDSLKSGIWNVETGTWDLESPESSKPEF